MKYRGLAVLPLGLVVAGCMESTTPVAPQLEQVVFTALGGLEVGETMDLRGAEAADVFLGGAGGEYVYIPFHHSTGPGQLRVTLEGEAIARPAALPLPGPAGSQLRVPTLASDVAHQKLHTRMRQEVEPLLGRMRTRPGALRPHSNFRSTLGELTVSVGEEVQLNTSTVEGQACEAIDLRTGRVEAVTRHAVIVGDLGNPAGGFTRADYQRFGEEIDRLVYPTLVENFGEPTDLDENDRIVVFFTRAVNEMTEPGGNSYVAGFFYGRDVLPVDLCSASNGGEMFYILAPDPFAEASHIAHELDDVRESALGTIGHELQHLINFSRRVWINDSAEVEAGWLDEGLSHIAEELLFYAEAGIEPRSNFAESDLDGATVTAINRYGVQNLVRFGLYLSDVTASSAISEQLGLETRGAAWAYLRYLLDHSGADDAQLLYQLVNSQVAGLDNLEAVFARDPMEALRLWGVSNFTDDYLRAPESPELQQPSWHFRSLLGQLFGSYPLQVQPFGAGSSEQLDLRAGSSGYLRFQADLGEYARVRASSGAGSAPGDALRVTVVRTR